MIDLDLAGLVLGGLVFFLAGFVKGIVGIGLPLIVIPILSSFVGVPTAIALMSVPVVTTNAWQMLEGGHFPAVARRFWPLLAAVCVGIAVGTRLLVTSDPRTVQALLGVIVVTSALLGHFRPEVTLPRHHESWLGPIVGFLSGLIGGFSSFVGPTLVVYLVALRLSKDEFVASVALTFFAAMVPLYIALAVYGVLGLEELALAAVATVPAFAGLFVGQRLRARVDQARFRRMLIVVLLLIGMNLIRKALAA